MLPILRLFHHRRGNETSRRALSLKTTDFDTIESMLQDPCAEPLCLPIDFLKAITRDFSSDQELGRGGHGVVYKVFLFPFTHFTFQMLPINNKKRSKILE